MTDPFAIPCTVVDRLIVVLHHSLSGPPPKHAAFGHQQISMRSSLATQVPSSWWGTFVHFLTSPSMTGKPKDGWLLNHPGSRTYHGWGKTSHTGHPSWLRRWPRGLDGYKWKGCPCWSTLSGNTGTSPSKSYEERSDRVCDEHAQNLPLWPWAWLVWIVVWISFIENHNFWCLCTG